MDLDYAKIAGLLDPQKKAELADVLGGSIGLNDQGEMLGHEQMLIDALRNNKMGNYSTGPGAALGGIGHVLDQLNAAQRESKWEDAQKDLTGKKKDSYNKLVSLLMEMQSAKAPQPNPAPTAMGEFQLTPPKF